MKDISREDALAHFGVRGMRWGVRNALPSDSSSASKKNKLIKTGNAAVKALTWSPISKETKQKLTTSKIKPIRDIQEKQRAANQALVNKLLNKISSNKKP